MDFPELMIMLAGVLFQESGTEEDTLRSKQLLERCIVIEPQSADAHLLKGKIHHKLQEWAPAATSL